MKKTCSLKRFNPDALELPTYLIILNEHKLKKIMKAWVYKDKRNLLIQNDIYVMLDSYQHRNNDRLLFYNNEKKYKTVYKKFNLNDKALYIPIEEYSKYYLQLKTKICTTVLEYLGVKTITFKHNEFTHSILNMDAHTTISNINMHTKINKEEKDTYRNDDIKIYNKGHCKYLFKEPQEFEDKMKKINGYLVDGIDFGNDLELRNLIRSRLVGNLVEYDLKYEIDYMSSMEVSLSASFTNSENAGLNVKQYANKKLNVNLRITFYNYSELINNDNIELKEKCLQLLVNNDNNSLDYNYEKYIIEHNTKNENNENNENNKECIIDNYYKQNLLNSFIDKYMVEIVPHKLIEYKMIKIADPQYMNSLIGNIKTMEDLSENGAFLNSFASLLYATLIPFNDEGLIRIQKIYTWIKRQNIEVEEINNDPNVCYNIRCDKPNCDGPIKTIKSIFCYIIRVYNQENPDNILTYGLETSKDFSEVLRYISINLKHFTNYSIFSEFVTKYINLYRVKNEPEFKKICKIDALGNIINKYIFKNKKNDIQESEEENETDDETDDNKSGIFNYINSIFYM
jgi:hypothetical protein